MEVADDVDMESDDDEVPPIDPPQGPLLTRR